MTPQQATIQYLKNCYQADNREQGLLHFFSEKVEEKLMLPDADMLKGYLPIQPVDDDWATSVRKKLQIYIKEKELLLCAFFICGTADIAGKAMKVCCPLFFIPLSIEQREEDFFIRPAYTNATINPMAIRLLSSTTDGAVPYEAIADMEALLSEEGFSFETVAELRRILARYMPKVHTEELLFYPTLMAQKGLVAQSKKGDIRVVPAAGAGIVSKSTQTLGLLHELDLLAENPNYSPALNYFLTGEVEAGKREAMQAWSILAPAILSASQEKLLRGIEQNTAMLIVGPPGTGKSYTIAALAVDRAARGESVLVVSANNQAVDVVERKIAQEFGVHKITVRAGGKGDYKRQLRDQLEAWLSGFRKMGVKEEKELEQAKESISDTAYQLDKQAIKLKDQASDEKRVGELIAEENLSFGKKITRWWKTTQLSAKQPIWEAIQTYLQKLEALMQQRREFLNDWFQFQRYQIIKTERKQLQYFRSALIARTSDRQESFFKMLDFGKISKAFPVWLVGIDEISHVLPMKEAMFDLVIIDEASQCDLASILPVLQRAKKLVVAGDPKQLRHVCFLGQAKQQAFAKQCGLSSVEVASYDYREMSVLDVASAQLADQDQLVFLDEHYRSHPSIINFSNQQFYEGQLRIMTAKPQMEGRESHLEVVRLQGKRNSKGYNEVEAAFILEKVAGIIEEQKDWAQHHTSIGILSPFRAQADYLQKKIGARFSIEALERHQLMVGTAHTFQGEERDVMFLSFVVDGTTHPSSFQHLGKTDVFNVSITRARNHQWLVTSLLEDVSYTAAGLLQRYLQTATTAYQQSQATALSPVADQFADLVEEWLGNFPVKVYRHYEIAGLTLDLLVVKGEKAFGIDLIGYPGVFEKAFPIERYKILNRMNLPLFSLPYRAWKQEDASAIHEALKDFLELG